ncbi:MAG: UDP-N-acetylmuramoyl-L-alanyl-D-glutamate--2,6-diaminopimelate ligase [Thermoleophilia bacterium]|nr:UDP-N-acetylmuramoyl-L-alanyl-D-glutamate--2,6-diaminopimelate ligase [Thermoleophilia bacterium]
MVESSPVRLCDLFAGVEGWRLAGAGDVDITSLCYRSDQAGPGSLFFCVSGFVRDGHDFAPDAVARGAAALCVERPLDLPVAQVVVPSVRTAMGPVGATFYGHPSSRLLTAGITGTNGKTTSAFLAAHLLDHAGLMSGLMGTVERRIGGRTLPAGRTTPEALDIQRDLALMVEAGDRAVVMEVSSHALDLGRAADIAFRAIAFTNLTQDHLDYHKTLEDYFAAKSRLFLEADFSSGRIVAVVNVDDPYGRELASRCPREYVMSFSSVPEISDWGPADLEMSDYQMDAGGTRGTLVVRGTALERAGGRAAPAPGGADGPTASSPAGEAVGAAPRRDPGAERQLEVVTPLVGAFNVANTLTALGIGLGLGLDLDGMLAGLRSFRGVPGRMESVDAGQDFLVLVDYAHTPDSVRNVLCTARGITSGKLIAVVGCGGDRDRTKRPLMGREAESAADLVVVTSDNPRSEDPPAIIAEIVGGLERPEVVVVQPDRRLAIAEAFDQAGAGDVVMILGKGHESGQEFATETIPFDDRQVARELLLARREGPAPRTAGQAPWAERP